MIEQLGRLGFLGRSVLVSARADSERFGKVAERDGVCVVDWHMPSAGTPFSYAVSVPKDSEVSRMISKSGSFVVNFMGPEHSQRMDFVKGPGRGFSDLFSFLKVSRDEAEKVDCPRVREARAHLECEVASELDSGDHTVFTGRVLGAGGLK